MNNGAIRLVCFDLGGVIVRICRSWREACELAGVVAAAGDDPASSPACLELHHLHQTGRIDLSTYARKLSAALASVGGRCSPSDIEAVHEAWILGEYDGVSEVIDAIHAAGLDTATLSNTSAEHWTTLLELPSIARIKHRHASHLLGCAKPDPAIYRAFERHVGCRGGEILFFDDLAENIAAAQEAGWRTAHIDHARPTAPQIAAALTLHLIATPNADPGPVSPATSTATESSTSSTC